MGAGRGQNKQREKEATLFSPFKIPDKEIRNVKNSPWKGPDRPQEENIINTLSGKEFGETAKSPKTMPGVVFTI